MAASKENILPAEVLKRREPHLVPGKLKITEWLFQVPLKHDEPDGEKLRLFARSAEKAEAGHTLESETSSSSPPSGSSSSKGTSSSGGKPWLFYLNGGPGGAAPLPQEASFTRIFLDQGYRVMLLDQRGAGLSSTLTARTLEKRGGPEEQAAFIKLFRADNIVRDFEAVRRAITAKDEQHKKISLLGQSFGGFCSTSYLSMFPEGLREVFLTGGLPPVGQDIDSIYKVLVGRAEERSKQFYEKFPEDRERAKMLVSHLRSAGKTDGGFVTTDSGVYLSEARFQALGVNMGGHGGFTRMHNLMVRMENDIEMHGFLTRPTMTSFENLEFFDDAILYAIAHEIIYLDGPGRSSSWSAEKILAGSSAYGKAHADEPTLYTTEMITHSTFRDHPELRKLLKAAEILYEDKDWPRLYNEEVLAKNTVPVFAAVYHDDLFVDFTFSLTTASKIRGCKTFITNRMYHDGIRSDAAKVMEELLALRDDTLD